MTEQIAFVGVDRMGGNMARQLNNCGLSLFRVAATRRQYDRMLAQGLGRLAKSGVAELSFKGPHA